MISVADLSKSFHEKEILNNVSFSLKNNEVVGLVGKNGVGKSTLLKILMGEIKADAGKIETGGEIIGYLPQFFDFGDQTIEDFLQQNDSLLEYKIDKVLGLLGLSKVNRNQKANELSGGQKTRLYLASVLLQEPTFLVLDEPTNNLDLDGLLWLEDFIKQFKGCVFLTSHDRAFLDNTVDQILEMDGGKVKSYGGNYTFYREKKLEEAKAYLQKYKQNIDEIKRLEELIIEKQNRIQKLAKDKGRDHERFEKGFFQNRATKKAAGSKGGLESRLTRIEKLEKPKNGINYPFGFVGATPNDKFIVGVKNLSKEFSGREIIQDVSFSVIGHQHVWLAGANGSGKSTLLNIILGNLLPDDGGIALGADVSMGYFSQDIENFDLEKTGVEELRSLGIPEPECFKAAAALHLSATDLKKQIKELSRGQIAKLGFVKLLMSSNQLLILDEPTNHLEIETREEIEEALKGYLGAILIASHDRYFLEEIGIDRTFLLKDSRLLEV